jgi:hypothetical protein
VERFVVVWQAGFLDARFGKFLVSGFAFQVARREGGAVRRVAARESAKGLLTVKDAKKNLHHMGYREHRESEETGNRRAAEYADSRCRRELRVPS